MRRMIKITTAFKREEKKEEKKNCKVKFFFILQLETRKERTIRLVDRISEREVIKST